MLSYIFYGGWELWFNHEQLIYHVIPQSRFERDYIISFFKGVGLSRYHTRMIAYKSWQKPLMMVIYLINDIRKLIYHFLAYRQVLKTDVVAAGEMELLINILISPFSYWKKD